jgi:hypothetical protein
MTMIYVIPPPKANFQHAFNNVVSNEIKTVGQTVNMVHTFEAIDGGLWVRKAQLVAVARNGTGHMRRVVPTDPAQDSLLVQIKTGNGRQLMSSPMDIHAFNALCDDPQWPGWTVPGGTTMTITVQHQTGTAANFIAPIMIHSSLSGFVLIESE